ncbi:MAG TPA: MBOAT family O-acyltransferase [Anaeromyxobacter sp.]|nr:MBOAT family O-acyltransferase [Anaeromyxobacter sp.]
MSFASLEFFVFLAIVLPLYYALEQRWQNRMLLLAGYFFYGWWDWRFLGLIGVSTICDYLVGLGLARLRPADRRRRWLLAASLTLNLGFLGTFKYFDFFASSAVELLERLGFAPDPVTIHVILPVGISFYTFQSMAYTIDVYRGSTPAVRSFVDVALYVNYFPQLVAGPIERAQNLLPQLMSRRIVTARHLAEGGVLILLGLFRKIVIADTVAPFVQAAFAHPDAYSSSGLLVATLLFSLQIYGDFAGYSDIARGTSKLMGIELMKNFEQPYFSTSITEFWRRWHVSLSTWLRDYLYVPLGGNRHGTLRTYRNLLLTMLLGGLWHGAAWGFVLWGALHGLYLAIHKLVSSVRPPAPDPPRLLQLAKGAAVFLLVSLTWIPFREPDGGRALHFLSRLLAWDGPLLDLANPGKVLQPGLALALGALATVAIDVPIRRSGDHEVFLRWPTLARASLYAVMAAGLTLFGGSHDVAFIYFQF